MTRKKPQAVIEILPRPSLKENALEQLAALVAGKLAERNIPPPQPEQKPREFLAELSDEVLLEPWFLPQETAYAILQLLPLSHKRKWSHYFENYGCLRCSRKKVNHFSTGMCMRCRLKVNDRLKASLKKHAQQNVRSPEGQIAEIVSAVSNAERILTGQTEHVRTIKGRRRPGAR